MNGEDSSTVNNRETDRHQESGVRRPTVVESTGHMLLTRSWSILVNVLCRKARLSGK